MLERTFCHLPRIGAATEEKLWAAGCRTWDDAMNGAAESVLGTRAALVRQALAESAERLEAGDADWFADKLPSHQQWRLLGAFHDRLAYVDIETTGLGMDDDHITTIALYDGRDVRTYVHGRNLEAFCDDVLGSKVLVTFNGKCFDAPFIERSFGIRLPTAHVDLRYALKQLGLSGGLKRCEKLLGLDREGMDGVDGYFAVVLWRHWERTGDPAALETLLAYNALDVVNLEPLAAHAYNELAARTPVAPRSWAAPAAPAAVPHEPDLALVARLKACMY